MVKGHVQIELHNHKTGFRERIEQDNLVTNAMNMAVSTLIGRGQTAATFMPLCTNFYGGVMLFEDPLTSSVTNVSLPTDNTIVGYAGQTATNSNKDMGSLNGIESGPVENGYMNVWDFSTSQANGTISSMALTNYRIGDGSLWTPIYFYQPYAGSDDQHSVLKRDNDYEYHLKNKIIYRKYIPINSYNLTDTNNLMGTAEDTGDRIGTASSYDYRNWRNGRDGYIYYSNYASNKLTIDKYDASDYSYVGTTTLSSTVPGISETLDLSNNAFWRGNIFVRDEKIYVFNHMSDYNGIFVFDGTVYDTTECIKSYTIQDSELAYKGDSAISNWSSDRNSWSRMYVTEDGTIWAMVVVKNSVKGTYGYFKQVFIKEESGVPIVKVYDAIFNGNGSALPYYRYDGISDIAYYGRYAANNMVSGNYLGTICNFDSPFDKTSTSSMKVKYTLTNV